MGQLTEKDHILLDEFLRAVLDRYKSEVCTAGEAVADIAHLVGLIDNGPVGGNPAEYMRAWLDEKRLSEADRRNDQLAAKIAPKTQNPKPKLGAC